MKRLTTTLLLLVLTLALPLSALAAFTPASERVLDGATLVCYGDGITAEASWPRTVATQFNMTLVNAAAADYTTAQAKDKLQQDVLDKKPTLAVLAFGSSDFICTRENQPRVKLDDFTANLTDLVVRLIANDVQPLLLTCPYMDPAMAGKPSLYRDAGGAMAVLDTYNAAIRTVAAANEVPLIDIAQECQQYDIGHFLQADGYHLAAQGNQHYARALGNVFNEQFKRDPNAANTAPAREPTIVRGVQTVSLVSLDQADWLAKQPELTFNQTDRTLALKFNGDDGLASYDLPHDGYSIPVKGTKLNFKLATGTANTTLTLLLANSTSRTAEDERLQLNLGSYLPNAQFTDGGALAPNQSLSGTLELTAEMFPEGTIDQYGFVSVNSLLVSLTRASGTGLTIQSLTVTTDGTGSKAIQPYETTKPIKSSTLVWLIVAAASILLIIVLVIYVVFIKKK